MSSLRLFTTEYLQIPNDAHDGWCFKCHEKVTFPEVVIVCGYKNCPNTFHLECLNMTKVPINEWTCPWHKCAEVNCNESSSSFCKNCSKAICYLHSKTPTKHTCFWFVFIF